MSRLGDARGADGADDERPIPPAELRAFVSLQCHAIRAAAEGLAVMADGADAPASIAYGALLELAQRVRDLVEVRLGEPPADA